MCPERPEDVRIVKCVGSRPRQQNGVYVPIIERRAFRDGLTLVICLRVYVSVETGLGDLCVVETGHGDTLSVQQGHGYAYLWRQVMTRICGDGSG